MCKESGLLTATITAEEVVIFTEFKICLCAALPNTIGSFLSKPKLLEMNNNFIYTRQHSHT